MDFLGHRSRARKRNIEFLFTFPEWVRAWGDRLPGRGRGADQYVMCRFGDKGPYAPWNVRIDHPRGNRREAVHIQTLALVEEHWGDNSSATDWLDNRRDCGYL